MGAVIEVPAGGAVARFRWTFEDLAGRTRITQRISLGGEGASALVNAIAPIFESSVPDGMQKLCEVMAANATV